MDMKPPPMESVNSRPISVPQVIVPQKTNVVSHIEPKYNAMPSGMERPVSSNQEIKFKTGSGLPPQVTHQSQPIHQGPSPTQSQEGYFFKYASNNPHQGQTIPQQPQPPVAYNTGPTSNTVISQPGTNLYQPPPPIIQPPPAQLINQPRPATVNMGEYSSNVNTMNIGNPNLPTYPFNSTTTNTQFTKPVNGNISINSGLPATNGYVPNVPASSTYATNSVPSSVTNNLPSGYNSVPMSGQVSGGGGDNSDFLKKIDEQL